MKIWNFLPVENIFLNVNAQDKTETLRFISDACLKNGVVEDEELLFNGLETREKTMSTGIGDGIGLPHTSDHQINSVTVLLITLNKPIDFKALDNKPVDIIISLIIPEAKKMLHIQLLAGISRLCKNPDFLSMVRQAKNSNQLKEEIRLLEENMEFH